MVESGAMIRRLTWPIGVLGLLAGVAALYVVRRSASTDRAVRWFDAIAAEVSRCRGLDWRRSPEVELCDSSALLAAWRLTIDSDEGASDVRWLHARHIEVPERGVLKASDVPIAFTDMRSGRVYMCRDLSEGERRTVLRHELTHSLENQHFEFQKRISGLATDLDGLFVVRCLLEGSAEEVRRQLELGQDASRPMRSRCAAPTSEVAAGHLNIFEVAPSALPHILGPPFIRQLVQVRGWSAVGDAYAAPPSQAEIYGRPAPDALATRARVAVDAARLKSVLGSPLRRRWWGEVQVAAWLDCLISGDGGLIRIVRGGGDALPNGNARDAAADLAAALMLDYELSESGVATVDILELQSSEGALRVAAMMRIGFGSGAEAPPPETAPREKSGSGGAIVAVSGRRVVITTGLSYLSQEAALRALAGR